MLHKATAILQKQQTALVYKKTQYFVIKLIYLHFFVIKISIGSAITETHGMSKANRMLFI